MQSLNKELHTSLSLLGTFEFTSQSQGPTILRLKTKMKYSDASCQFVMHF